MSGFRKYILVDKVVTPAKDLWEWAEFLEKNFQVWRDYVNEPDKPSLCVSTIFTGLDDQIFETMILGGSRHLERWRTFTWDEARAAHVNACALAIAQDIKDEFFKTE